MSVISTASDRAMSYMWRRLHALGKCKHVKDQCCPLQSHSREEWAIDAGYCLDRYSIEPEPGVFFVVRP